jgi:hypothetical protein
MTHGSLDREAHDSFIRLPHSAHLLPKSSSSSSMTRPPSLRLRWLTAALATPPPRSPTTVVALDTLLDSPPPRSPHTRALRPRNEEERRELVGRASGRVVAHVAQYIFRIQKHLAEKSAHRPMTPSQAQHHHESTKSARLRHRRTGTEAVQNMLDRVDV